ncbi:glycosyltransferase [Asanoa sp. NPDC049573]|uniref:glycosyltransferase family 2 protein n=1 Tax=Asanoa sp. NPDC049573 TaxID=3155396 RepID=UPI00342A2B34
MTFSIVIPVYGQRRALAHTLASLVTQTAPATEVIVVDDGSPEPAAPLVAEFADRLTVECVRHDANRGRAAARNIGAARATGEHLVFLDADSVAHPRLLETHRERHGDPPRVVLGRRIKTDWRTTARFADPATLPTEVPPHQDDGRYALEVDRPWAVDRSPWVFLHSHNFSLPRAVFAEVGGFDEAFDRWGWEDTELGYRLFRHWRREPGRFVWAPDAVCYQVPHYSDLTANWRDAKAGLAYLQRKHEHWEVERLGFRLRDAVLDMPAYTAFLDRPDNGLRAPALERLLPTGGRRLWAGPGANRLARSPAATLDVRAPRSGTNKQLLGLATPWDDGAFDEVVHWETWRMLTMSDLGQVIRESLRLAAVLILAGVHDADLAAARSPDVLSALETAPLTVRQLASTTDIWAIEVRARE